MKNILGTRIKEIRKQKNLTQTDLSRLTGYSQNSISTHENGKRKIDEEDIQVYTKALGIKAKDLFENYEGDGEAKEDSEEIRVMYRGMRNMTKKDQKKAIKLFEMIFDDWDDFKD